MSACFLGSMLEHLEGDAILYNIDWIDLLTTNIRSSIAVKDQIATSIWALDAASPATDLTIGASDFDPASGQTWVTIEGGTVGSNYHVINTIETAGAVFGTHTTPGQRFTRKLNIRVVGC